MSKPKGRAGIQDGETIAVIKDRFGEHRRVVQRGSRIRIAANHATPIIAMNREIAKIIGDRIRALREERGLSLEQLAVRCGMSSGWPKNRMYEIERGQRQQGVRLGTLYAVAAALEVQATELMPLVSEVLAKAEVKRSMARIVTLTGAGKVVDVA